MDRKACERHGIVPMMAEKRDTHLGWLDPKLAAVAPLPESQAGSPRITDWTGLARNTRCP
jgi:hypothetical protein